MFEAEASRLYPAFNSTCPCGDVPLKVRLWRWCSGKRTSHVPSHTLFNPEGIRLTAWCEIRDSPARLRRLSAGRDPISRVQNVSFRPRLRPPSHSSNENCQRQHIPYPVVSGGSSIGMALPLGLKDWIMI